MRGLTFGWAYIIGVFFIPESPGWLGSVGKMKESVVSLDVIARQSNTQLPTNILQMLKGK